MSIVKVTLYQLNTNRIQRKSLNTNPKKKTKKRKKIDF